MHSGLSRTVRLTNPGQSAVQPNGYLSRQRCQIRPLLRGRTVRQHMADRPQFKERPVQTAHSSSALLKLKWRTVRQQGADRPPFTSHSAPELLKFWAFFSTLPADRPPSRAGPSASHFKPRRGSKPRLTSPKPRMTSLRRPRGSKPRLTSPKPRLTSADPGAKPRRSSPG
jgi:hypothetical protein